MATTNSMRMDMDASTQRSGSSKLSVKSLDGADKGVKHAGEE